MKRAWTSTNRVATGHNVPGLPAISLLIIFIIAQDHPARFPFYSQKEVYYACNGYLGDMYLKRNIMGLMGLMGQMEMKSVFAGGTSVSPVF